MHESPFLNLYLYPAEADYERTRPLGESWQRLDSCVRSVDEPFEPPPGDGALVYVSLGSLGSADVELMNRLVAALAETPHRYVVSKGPQHESIELAPNMTGAEFLPQPAILPQADLVITHGGNNTVTESIHFGKPMVVLPLFWDQHDNAQRVEEVGFGVRLRDLRVRGRPAARRDRRPARRRTTAARGGVAAAPVAARHGSRRRPDRRGGRRAHVVARRPLGPSAHLIRPKSPSASPSGPAVKKSVPAVPLFPPCANWSAQRPSISSGWLSAPLSLPSCTKCSASFAIRVDPPVAEVPDEQVARERAEARRRHCQAPRRVQLAVSSIPPSRFPERS